MPLLPTDIPTGRVVGSFAFLVQDGLDGDTKPDSGAVLGTVTFTCSASLVRFPAKPLTAVPLTFTAEIANDSLTALGGAPASNGIELLATDSAVTNPTGFTWRVDFNLRRADNFAPISLPSFDIQVPTGATIDLTTVMPVAQAPGVLTLQGPRGDVGPKGDKGDRGADGANVLPTDTAIANQVKTKNTATRGALDDCYTSRTIRLLILMGQSNMSGRGILLNSAVTDPTHPRIYQYGAKTPTLRAASEPLDMRDSPSGMGPGLQIARRMVDKISPDDVIVLVPTAYGGTSLSSNAALAWRWGVAGNLTAQAIAQTDAAIAAAQAQWPGADVEISGIFWVQGENDGTDGTLADAYQADLEALINGLRTKYGSNVPFVMGQMLRAGFSSGTRAQINWAQTRVANKLPRIGFALAPTEQNGDNTHYSAAGQRKLGSAMYQEWVRASAGLASVTTIEPPAGTTLITDDFERPDDVVGKTPSGQAWLGQTTGTLIPARIISGNIGHNSSTGAWSYWTVDAGATDYTATTTVGALNSNRISTWLLKYVDANNWVALYLAQGGTNRYRITGLSGGATTTVFDSTVAQQSTDLLKAKVAGDTVTVWAGTAGDVLVGTYTLQGVLPQGTRCGFGFHPTSANTWAYLTVTA